MTAAGGFVVLYPPLRIRPWGVIHRANTRFAPTMLRM